MSRPSYLAGSKWKISHKNVAAIDTKAPFDVVRQIPGGYCLSPEGEWWVLGFQGWARVPSDSRRIRVAIEQRRLMDEGMDEWAASDAAKDAIK